MERFVQLIVAGGVVLVGALWLVAVAEAWSAGWLAAVALALLGTGATLAGILRELEPGAFAVGEE